MIVAAVPDFLFGFLTDNTKVWASARGTLIYFTDHALPFITAVLAAGVCQRVLAQRSARVQSVA